MFGSDNCQIRHGLDHHIGELTVDTTVALPYGSVMDQHATDNTKAILGVSEALGLLSKRVTPTGPTFEQMTLGQLNLDAKSGDKVSLIALVPGGTLELEGAPSIGAATAGEHLLVTTGTGALSGSTAKNTQLSVINGRWYEAQTGDRVLGRMLKADLTPLVVGNIRCLIEVIKGNVL